MTKIERFPGRGFRLGLLLSICSLLVFWPDGNLTVLAGSEEGEQLITLLRQRLDDQGQFEDIKIDAYCYGDQGVRSAVVYGRGVGIWNGQGQFEVERETVAAMLRRFVDSKFGEMEEVYGGRDDPGDSAVRVICRAGLTIGERSRYSSQLDKGRQSKELKALADAILDLCQEPAQRSKTIASVDDGLAQLAAGRLAPEMLTIQLHRRKEGVREEGQPGGWLFRVEGPQAKAQRFVAGKGFDEPLRTALSPDQLRELARKLGDLGVGSLPVNLFADEYTDLTVAVLNREKQVQARRFAGMTPSTHGEKQARFEKLYKLLSEMAERILEEGKSAPQ